MAIANDYLKDPHATLVVPPGNQSPGDYARVDHVDAKTNQVTVTTDDERELSYDARRLQGVTRSDRGRERAYAGAATRRKWSRQ